MRRAPGRLHQRGAATLVVVMVLFFVMSLVAAYASRNIIFEQRTSANLYTATSTFEAADAGLQWALGFLNGGRIDDNCQKPAGAAVLANPSAYPSFRQRYLRADEITGNILIQPGVRDGPMWPSCWFNTVSNAWVCHCPGDPAAPGAIASLPTASIAPAFSVRFVQLNDSTPPSRPGSVRIEIMGCLKFDPACLTFPAAHATECRGTVCATVALSPGVKSAPAAAITAHNSIAVTGTGLTAAIPRAGMGGYAAVSGGTISGVSLVGPPGSSVAGGPPSVQNATALSDPLLWPARMFAAVFGSWPSTYIEQPGAVRIDCSATCNADDIRSAVTLNPGLAIVASGDVTLNGGSDIGSPAEPVAMVVTGDLGFSAATNVFGLIYVKKANWATAGSGTVTGGVVAEGQISGSGGFSAIFDPLILGSLGRATGSYVVVPGSWKDFP
ncbi:MAG: PilX N-terminal domain-containing pilus assembly protein [Rubrivivax sp.]